MKTARVTVPGKAMLAGEYAVLRGASCLAVTLDSSLTATFEPGDLSCHGDLTPRPIILISDLWPQTYEVAADAKWQDLLQEPLAAAAALGRQRYSSQIGWGGGRLTIKSGLKVEHGVGSSSALCTAALLAMAEASGCEASVWDAATDAVMIQRSRQSAASGYDIATQMTGGLVLYRPPVDSESWPGNITRLGDPCLLRLSSLCILMVGGRGAPTAKVMKDTLAWLDDAPGRWSQLTTLSQILVRDFCQVLSGEESPETLFQSVGRARDFWRHSPHFPSAVARTLDDIFGLDNSWSYKTSGAGGEDALLLLGAPEATQEARVALEGLGWHPTAASFRSWGAESQRGGTLT